MCYNLICMKKTNIDDLVKIEFKTKRHSRLSKRKGPIQKEEISEYEYRQSAKRVKNVKKRTVLTSDKSIKDKKIYKTVLAAFNGAVSKVRDFKLDKVKFPKLSKDVSLKETKETVEEENAGRPKAKRGTFIAACVVWTIIIFGLIGVVGGLYIAKEMLKDIPEFNSADLVAPESSLIYDANGNVLAELGEYKRENVGYDKLPNILVDAFLSIEDSRYFEHFGFDIPRFTKAALENLKSGNFDQGGSTFTMQLIKNTYFQVDAGENSTIAEKKVSRKLQEIVLAIKADHELNKKDVFALYLNRINFGNNIRGVERAAEYYFNKKVGQLNLSEAAFLAGIINSPNIFNPYNDLIKDNPDSAYTSPDINYLAQGEERRNEVLNMMVYHGYITKEEAKAAKAIKLVDLLAGESITASENTRYYQDYIDAVIDETIEKTGKDPYYTSMEIYTNMDPYMQKLVYDIQNENTGIKFNQPLMQSAIVTMNNQTGAIVALGGGKEESEADAGARKWNRATMSKIQPGSAIKPIVDYVLAFDQLGWATTHTLCDQPIFLYGSDNILITNWSRVYKGDVLLEEALGDSLNTTAIETLQAVVDAKGEQFVVDYLNSIGIETTIDDFDLQFAIGGNRLTVTPVEMAGAHAMIINYGKYIEPHTINKIVYSDGSEYVADTEGTQIVKPGAAWMMTRLLYTNVYGSVYNSMYVLKTGYPVFGKTGTTDWGSSGLSYGIPRGAKKDNWLVSSTSNYTNVVWVGFDKLERGAYMYNDTNIKGRISRKLLDEEVKHFDYEPTDLTMSDDVRKITHVKGVYPYVEPKVGTSVTGYILKDFYRLNPVSSIKYETKTRTFSGVKASLSNTTLNVEWVLSGGESGGQKDISATSSSGRVVKATGRSFFPTTHWVNPTATYYLDIYHNGSLYQTISSNVLSASVDLSALATPAQEGDTANAPAQISGSIRVCAYSSTKTSQKYCQDIK